MDCLIKYGVSQRSTKSFVPVLFVNDQKSSYCPITKKTPKAALKYVEEWANEIMSEWKHFGNKVTLVKWEHSII